VRDKDAEIARLHAIVDQLPKTRDGVPVVPGMNVWEWDEDRQCARQMMSAFLGEADFCVLFHGSACGRRDGTTTYSTRQAAAAAREEKP
jgi:hypothetical protein